MHSLPFHSFIGKQRYRKLHLQRNVLDQTNGPFGLRERELK